MNTRGIKFHVNGRSLDIRLTRRCADECSHSGRCDSDVAWWVDALRPKLEAIDPKIIADILRDYGAWDSADLADTEQNLHRLLWVAAGDVKDEKSCWITLEP